MTCAQIAIMPRNNASEASAAASSMTERNIATSHGTKRERCSHSVRAVKGELAFGKASSFQCTGIGAAARDHCAPFDPLRLHHLPIAQRDAPVHPAGDLHVVGGAQHGEAGGTHQLGERLEHML